MTRRQYLLVPHLAIYTLAVMLAAVDYTAAAPQRQLIYNNDGDGVMWHKKDSMGPTPITVEDLRTAVREISYEGSQMDTLLLCTNAQVMYYPTAAGTMRGELSTPAERENWPEAEKQRYANMNNFFDNGIDPYAVMLGEAKGRGLEAMLTFRMNDAHSSSYLRTQFWMDNSGYRLGYGLDFGQTAVRDYVFGLIEETVQRYGDCDGIELDFQRFPSFFKSGTAVERVVKMNSLVERVRDMLDVEGTKRGRHLALTARIPTNYDISGATYEASLAIGCDPLAWAQEGWVDSLTVSNFLHNGQPLNIADWQDLISEVPIYGAMQFYVDWDNHDNEADMYRARAEQLWEDGVDGVYLFNFFCPRGYDENSWEPPFEVLAEIGGVVPEPSSIALVLCGLVVLLAYAWRKRK